MQHLRRIHDGAITFISSCSKNGNPFTFSCLFDLRKYRISFSLLTVIILFLGTALSIQRFHSQNLPCQQHIKKYKTIIKKAQSWFSM